MNNRDEGARLARVRWFLCRNGANSRHLDGDSVVKAGVIDGLEMDVEESGNRRIPRRVNRVNSHRLIAVSNRAAIQRTSRLASPLRWRRDETMSF